jgi:hypothetical protein
LDAYDPNLEQDLNNATGDTTDVSYGFTGTQDQSAPTNDTGSSREQLLNLIKQRELKK